MHIKPVVVEANQSLNVNDSINTVIARIKTYGEKMSIAVRDRKTTSVSEDPKIVSECFYAYTDGVSELFAPLCIDHLYSYFMWIWSATANTAILEWEPWTPKKLETIFGIDSHKYFANLDGQVIFVIRHGTKFIVTGLDGNKHKMNIKILCEYLQNLKLVQLGVLEEELVLD